jgi:hypothetical protein
MPEEKKKKKEEKKKEEKNTNFWKKMGDYVKKAVDCCKE